MIVTTPRTPVSINNIAGLNAKIYGTMNAAIARRDAFNAVFIGLDFAIADPA